MVRLVTNNKCAKKRENQIKWIPNIVIDPPFSFKDSIIFHNHIYGCRIGRHKQQMRQKQVFLKVFSTIIHEH